MAVAKHVDMLAAVRTYYIAVVFDDAQNRDVHHFSHLNCLGDNHGYQLLRRGHDDDAVDRQRLKDRQRNVTGSWRHIDEHKVNILPDDIGPELLNSTGDNRTSPDNRIRSVFHQQIDGANVNAGLGSHRVNAFLCCTQCAGQTKALRDRRAGDIGIQNAAVCALTLHSNGEQRSDHALAYAALAADNADDFLDFRKRMRCLEQRLRLAAASSAAVAIVITTHDRVNSF